MNPYGRSAQEQREHDRLRYPGTDVLINKHDIRVPAKLELVERAAAQRRMQDGLPTEAKHFTVEGVQAIHRHLLGDVYDWAGSFRRYTTGRGSAPFAPPDFIQGSLGGLMDKLKEERFLHGLDQGKMAARAAHYVNELNAVHPFVDGNGRMQRTWLRNLCEQAGHHLQFRPGDRDAWNAASASGFYENDDRMTAFLSERLRPLAEKSRDAQGIPDPSSDRLNELRDRYRKSDDAAKTPDKQKNGQKQ